MLCKMGMCPIISRFLPLGIGVILVHGFAVSLLWLDRNQSVFSAAMRNVITWCVMWHKQKWRISRLTDCWMLLYISSSCGIISQFPNETEHLRIGQHNWDTTRYMHRKAKASSEDNILAKRARNKLSFWKAFSKYWQKRTLYTELRKDSTLRRLALPSI